MNFTQQRIFSVNIFMKAKWWSGIDINDEINTSWADLSVSSIERLVYNINILSINGYYSSFPIVSLKTIN